MNWSPVEEKLPFEQYPLNGLLCAICGELQRNTPGGASCVKGHGGADGIAPPPSNYGVDFPSFGDSERWELIQGDCLAVLKTLDDESCDACCTDPPYGLSKEPNVAEVMHHWLAGERYEHGSARQGKKNCAANLLGVSCVTNTHDTDAEAMQVFIPFTITISTAVVRLWCIKLDDESARREVEVDDEGSLTRDTKYLLVDERDTKSTESLSRVAFSLRKRQGFTGCVGACACFSQTGKTIFRIPIRLSNDTFGEAECFPSVMTLAGAERSAVLTLDACRRTAHLALAESASDDDTTLLLLSSKPVRTFTRARRLSTPVETPDASQVDLSADRTGAVNLFLHQDLLSRLLNPIIVQGGMMGKTWDSFVPGPEYWREVYRVLKPGGYLLAFAGTRTMDLMSIAMRFAGFENRDTISVEGVLRWVYGSGFPKSLDVSKVIKEWVGFGTALKPAWEPILCFRKPLVGTVAQNVVQYGTGVLNIDNCRIGTEIAGKDGGRHPSNLVLLHSPDCKQIGTQIIKGDSREGSKGTRPGGFFAPGSGKGDGKPCGKLYGDTEVPVYACSPTCPVAALDVQSGIRTSGSRKAGVRKGMGYGGADGDGGPAIEGSTGGASRFFPVFRPDFLYQAKPSPREKNAGLDGKSTHPTVKSIALCRWLCRLIGGQPGSIILDPFAGSGSILIAALLEGFKAVGIEREQEYIEIARRRIEWWQAKSQAPVETPLPANEV